jgi:hypothetical protein
MIDSIGWVIIFLYLDRAIRSEEAGFVDPEFFIVKPLPENLSTSYGGTQFSFEFVAYEPTRIFCQYFQVRYQVTKFLISYRKSDELS